MRVDVLIAGAGPAGAAAARALARAGVRVALVERGEIGRPRLCGEFLSPEAAVDLEALDLDVCAAGAIEIGAATVRCGGASTATVLAPPGFAIAREVFDAYLVDAAVGSGATLHAATEVAAVQGDAARGFRVTLAGRTSGTCSADMILGAFGRRAPKWLGRQPEPPRRAAIALKVHLRDARGPEPARVALHAFDGGYIGVAPVGDERVNLCLVAHHGAAGALAPGGARGALATFVARVPALGALWERAEIVPASLCATSGLRFGIVHPTHGDVLLLGDAAAQPHPASGDGMAMALRSARLAAAFVLAALDGRMPADRVAAAYARAWRREFTARLRWARLVHTALARPRLLGPTLVGLACEPHLLAMLLARTRGAQKDILATLAPEA